MKTQPCRLCHNTMTFFAHERKRDYYRCSFCDSIQMDHNAIISYEMEKHRYDQHNNDIHDLGYQAFVSPITDYIFKHYTKDQKGLDFGAGPGPVIAKMLRGRQYDIVLYDPYFHQNDDVLKQTYDYIIACEVIEHFNQAHHAFQQLKTLTDEKTEWIFMTQIYEDSIDFSTWHYKNDETHVIFYTKKTLAYLKTLYNWKRLIIDGRLIIFTNH